MLNNSVAPWILFKIRWIREIRGTFLLLIYFQTYHASADTSAFKASHGIFNQNVDTFVQNDRISYQNKGSFF